MNERLGLLEIAKLIRDRERSPVEVVQETLRNAAQLNPDLNAYITIMADLALQRAREAEKEIGQGQYKGPLHGVPVSVKDIFAARGTLTTSGSRVLSDYIPDHDAAVVQKLREAGAILIAKANTFQFACSPPHPDYGPTRNPWNLARTTRGSSSGSAAAVASGIDYGSIGSDTGGSIRVPASFSGVVGLKPTYGRVSRFGMQPVSWTLDHSGPIARSVGDVALLLAAIAGPDSRDPGSIDAPFLPASGDAAGLEGVTIGRVQEFFSDDVDPGVQQSVDRAITVLRDLGASVRDVSLPDLLEPSMVAYGRIMWPEAAHSHRKWFPSRAAEYTELLQRRLANAGTVLAIDYLQGLEERRRIRTVVAEVQEEIDLLVLPTTSMVATPLESVEPAADDRLEESAAVAAPNAPFDLTGQPAMTIPCGFSEGLPVGMQIVGRFAEDELVIRCGLSYQSVTEWHHAVPTISTLSQPDPGHGDRTRAITMTRGTDAG